MTPKQKVLRRYPKAKAVHDGTMQTEGGEVKKTCLTCKYEPVWSEPSGTEYPRRNGACRWDGKIPVLPWAYTLTKRHVIRYSDNSGIPTNCKAWEPKP